MNNMKKLAFSILAAATLSGCATTELAAPEGAQKAEQQVLRPLPSYGTMGGYRYRRFVAVSVPAS